MPEVADHVVGVDRGHHVAEGAVVGAVGVCVPRGVHVHGHCDGDVLRQQHEQRVQGPVQGNDRGSAEGQYHGRCVVGPRMIMPESDNIKLQTCLFYLMF